MADSGRTKRVLAQAMKDLMAARPFAKISVGDICDHCGMNRKSFYYHFRDKYDLVNWIFYTEFIQSVQAADYRDSWSFLDHILHYLYGEQVFYRRALQISGQNSFREYFCDVIKPYVASFARDLFPEEGDGDFYVAFFTDALLVSILRWLGEGAGMTPDEYLAHLRRIMVRLARHIISDLEDGEGGKR